MMASAVATAGADPIAGEDHTVIAPVIITNVPGTLRANPTRVVIRPFMLAEDLPSLAAPDSSRTQRIANRILHLGEVSLEFEWKGVLNDLYGRHRDFKTVRTRHRRSRARSPRQ